MSRRRGLLRIALAAGVPAAVGCSDAEAAPETRPVDGGPATEVETTTTVQPTGPPYEVDAHVEVLTDTSRPSGGQPGRRLETLLTYPAERDGGPHPLIVFAHGCLDEPTDYTEPVTAWAEAGYVVAAPAFPRTGPDAPGGPDANDLPNQPVDVLFVLDELGRRAASGGHRLSGWVDLERVGVDGHGMGVTTVLASAFHSCCRDDHIEVVAALSGVVIDFEGTSEFSSVPLFIAFGDADEFLAPTTGQDLYGRAEAPRYLLTIAGGSHDEPYQDGRHPADEAVAAATTRFWDHDLAGSGTVDDLLQAAAVEGLTLENET